MNTDQKLPPGFSSPTALPDEGMQSEWQVHNRTWWQNNPMRYDWNNKIPVQEFSREFYQEIDSRFFSDAARYLPPTTRPFDQLIPFDQISKMDVLEIGVGNGSHAQLLSQCCKSYTGIDLTDYAVKSTTARFQAFGLKGVIRQMDAEDMSFEDASFDFIWTWGVIHHSSNTDKILKQMNRVLRPGGVSTIMVYYRSFFYFYIFTAIFRGIFQGGFLKTRSLHELVQLYTDGAIARFYTKRQWKELVEANGFEIVDTRIMGQKSEIIPLPSSKFKNFVMRLIPNSWSRFITNTLEQGSFLVTTIRKV